jgi:hypothetical protein
LNPKHRPSEALDSPMVLFDDVAQILDLMNLDRCLTFGIDRVKRSQIGTALVYGHRLGRAVLSHGLLKEAPRNSLVTLGSEQKINGVARLVHPRYRYLH